MTTAPTPKPLPRDVFIDEVYAAAKKNKDLYFLCCDLGALALDKYREELAPQFIHTGISEQNTIDMAAGLALNGKTVIVYMMGSFVTTRCLEQSKVTLAAMKLPVTLVGVGVGYGYDDAGPTHYPIDDLTVMRSLGNIEIVTPADTQSVREVAKQACEKPGFRYVRLDRIHLPEVYGSTDQRFLQDGVVEVVKGDDVCIVSHGYMLHRALEARTKLAAEGLNVGVIDAFRLKPYNPQVVASILSRYNKIVTLEEHFLSGGLGSTVLEWMADNQVVKPVKRLGIQDVYRFENGGRTYIQKLDQLDLDSVCEAVRGLTKTQTRQAAKPAPAWQTV